MDLLHPGSDVVKSVLVLALAASGLCFLFIATIMVIDRRRPAAKAAGAGLDDWRAGPISILSAIVAMLIALGVFASWAAALVAIF